MALAHVYRNDFNPNQYNPCLLQEAYIGELSELRQQASWLSHLVDTLPAGVIVLDGRGMIAKANQIAISMLGEPLEGEKWLTVIQRSFNPRQDDGHEVSLRDGRRVKLEISALSPEPGQLILMTDLTETRRLQERLAHMQRLSALGKMVATLAHQVRTPLSAAMLYAANLGNKALTGDAKTSFHSKLMSRLKDLETQVNDMLLFAKSGEQQVVEKLSLQQLLSEVKLGSEAMMNLNHAQLIIELPEPDIEITGNKTALAGAIGNLIHNSVHIIGKGAQVVLSAARDPSIENGVVISVSDNGPGVPLALQQKIFEPFFTTRSQGTGLGLAVVNSIATSHQGRVSLVNNPNKGATFNIHIPVFPTADLSEES
ncbi:sensor histidine kinase [Pseudoalteromonas tunicata]|uniref:histidine kinase n=1 Tax=Pseudoalteromonas tunicata D2 TaxID=87626 RepID=A4C6D7_9GAMM|nr:ATP-binding protein [Pseudoalteromonas tunicata]ATC95516.1 two-component system, sensor histidine kinase FlrB [Pseudoalteromonas tunicata]AXT31090.1 PAS domain-containing sensor histidine kinase [Pseudoalteromonas tunicata]EAR29541.1 putative sensory box sensor histidine kinase in two-component regulatory system [Pseudoalteromonas tunicata D2]MDP4982529.1 ATP-binding protein [Pseudoalteromonas tunicata]MDP5212445.1 ATP-binding protein [Pseudoalteromonas tunicata]